MRNIMLVLLFVLGIFAVGCEVAEDETQEVVEPAVEEVENTEEPGEVENTEEPGDVVDEVVDSVEKIVE